MERPGAMMNKLQGSRANAVGLNFHVDPRPLLARG